MDDLEGSLNALYYLKDSHGDEPPVPGYALLSEQDRWHLTPIQREVINLRAVLSRKDAAAARGVSLKAIRQCERGAIRRLIRRLIRRAPTPSTLRHTSRPPDSQADQAAPE